MYRSPSRNFFFSPDGGIRGAWSPYFFSAIPVPFFGSSWLGQDSGCHPPPDPDVKKGSRYRVLTSFLAAFLRVFDPASSVPPASRSFLFLAFFWLVNFLL